MLPQNIFFVLASAGLISAVPLNINLGAYSPAFVVGDGEISLGGAQSAGELMETLASGANPGTATQGEGEGQPAPAQPSGTTAAVITPPSPAAQADDIIPEQPKDQVENADEAENQDVVGGMISKGMTPALKIPSSGLPRPNMEKRAEPELAAREPEPSLTAADKETIKREINGFNAALSFAMNAMKNQPEVELGTGGEGSGVGVIVNPGVSVPNGSPAAGRVVATPEKVKRYVQPGASMGVTAEQPRSGITLMAIAEI